MPPNDPARRDADIIHHLARSLAIVIGLVLIWRGVWYILDELDIYLAGGNHLWSAAAGIALGLLILYLPDHDFKEIEKL